MPATLTSSPATPASVYRPLAFVVTRTDPVPSLVTGVFIATETHVTDLGGDLEEGDVVVAHGLYQVETGGATAQVGQTVLITSAGPYTGVQRIAKTPFVVDGVTYTVIDSADLGAYTGTSATTLRLWLDNYQIIPRVLIYTDPATAPQIVTLKGVIPGPDKKAIVHVEGAIERYFSHRIEPFVESAAPILNAHGVTALFYRVHLVEGYDLVQDGAAYFNPDPFEGDWDIVKDDTNNVLTFRVAVNGIHPYGDQYLPGWEVADMDIFTPDIQEAPGDPISTKWMTHAPREPMITSGTKVALELHEDDRFRLHMLTDRFGENYTAVYKLRIRDITSGIGIGASIGLIDVTLGSTVTAAFSVGVGPADLAPYVTVPGKYRVNIAKEVGTDTAICSEYVDITVHKKCGENRRVFGWLNKLGGIDQYTFRGREKEEVKVVRSAVEKPMGRGTGYDFTRRTTRVIPQRLYMASTGSLSKEERRWLAEDLVESVRVETLQHGKVTGVSLVTSSVPAHSTGKGGRAMTVEFSLDVDNQTQRG
jgi:hypothetical protein